jgi:peptidyl-prolyl cis-trans isomerase D
MSVIQRIRDKGALISAIIIAISLLGFILMDAFSGRTGLFNNGPNSNVGKINGKAIDRIEFDKKVKAIEAQYKDNSNEDMRFNIMQSVWDEEVSETIMQKEYDKLGLTVTDKELNELLYGANPPQFLSRDFVDPKTGKYDAMSARMQVNQVLKSGTVEQKDYVNQQIDQIKQQKLMAKYMFLLLNSVSIPKWFIEKQSADNSLIGKFDYVLIPYNSIPDSTVKISDDEIRDYMKEHRDEYEQKDEARSISYVVFNASPSAKDSADEKAALETLKPGFIATNDAATYIQQNGSTLNYYDGYLAKSAIQVPSKDSIFNLAKGAVYGPYLDGGNWTMAKLIDVKTMPDSAKAKHILIATADPQSGQQILPDSIAKARIDSIKLAIDRGANFDTLAKKFSDDKSSAENGGLVRIPDQQNQAPTSDYFTQGRTVKSFNDSVFNGKAGQRKIVKSEFGYHLIEILDLKNIEPHYKVAYLSKEIVPSTTTDQQAQNEATNFAGDSRDIESFNNNWDKKLRTKGINKSIATDIGPMDNVLTGLPSPRGLIKKIFEAKKGEVIGPERVGQNYVVAVVTEITDPGLKSVNSVRVAVEPILRNKKKAEIIMKKVGKFTSLEEVAAKQNPAAQVQHVDSVYFSGNSKVGFEPRVMGAVFNPDNKGKTVQEPIEGVTGVFLIRVGTISAMPVTATTEQQIKMAELQSRQSLMQQLQQGMNPILETLKKTAKIKDYRADFY